MPLGGKLTLFICDKIQRGMDSHRMGDGVNVTASLLVCCLYKGTTEVPESVSGHVIVDSLPQLEAAEFDSCLHQPRGHAGKCSLTSIGLFLPILMVG